MRRWTPYWLLVPALLLTALVLVFPLVQNLLNSLRDVSLIKGAGDWTGLSNYRSVLDDELFWLSFKNTAFYAAAGTLLSLLIGLFFALLLNARTGPIRNVAEFLYTIPWVVSPVVAGFAWKWLLNDNFGIINYWLISAGVVDDGITWLGSTDTALACVVAARVWQFYPFAMVMFLAGLQGIPQEQYEAASVDGASSVRKFYHVTLPNLGSVTSVLLPLGIIWSFNDFNMVFVMTRGGPINASMVLPVLVREYSFVHFDLGMGSALSIIVFAVLVVLSLVYVTMIGRRESL